MLFSKRGPPAILSLVACGAAASCMPTFDVPHTVAPAPLRRLNNVEYNNTVYDLLGDDSAPANQFPVDVAVYSFTNNVESQLMTTPLAQAYLDAADMLAQNAVQNLDPVALCAGTPDETTCAQNFIRTFGQRAFRRPLDDATVTSMLATYTAGRAQGDVATGIQYVITRMLQSPRFLYRVENDGGDLPVLALDGYQLATRLSYFLWGSMPDDALLDAAAAGNLATKAGIADEARRMLADPRAHTQLQQFFAEWLSFGDIDTAVKDPTLFPAFTSDTAARMRAAENAFIEYAMWQDKGDLATLLTAPYAFADSSLATFYGVDAPAAMSLTQLDPSKRAGFLTHVGFLAAAAKIDQTSPIHRGHFVRTQLLCDTIPSPPPSANVTPPPELPNGTERQRYAPLLASSYCATCHELMNPIGYTFEQFDAVGAWRTTQNGQTIDPSGDAVQSDIGPFANAVTLAHKLAKSDQVRACVVKNWFRFANGRAETSADAPALATMQSAFPNADTPFVELMVAITQTDSFRYRAGASFQGP